MNAAGEFERWLLNAKDAEIQNELRSLIGNDTEINERFYKELSFGTGGLRGVIGAGTNRMNIYSVSKATFGLAEYLKETCGSSVVIAYDSRNKSAEFAKLAAVIMSSKGIKAYLFSDITPTPVLSFAVRYLRADAGIVITASHNPKEYNGYKVYNSRGCQITDEAAEAITQKIACCDYFDNYVCDESRISVVDQSVERAFLDEIKRYSLTKIKVSSAPSVVYSPLNGTGGKYVQKILNEIGVSEVYTVKEQEMPDGSFATCPYPNPEDGAALELALRDAELYKPDLVLATDPDSDRIGVAVPNENGEYVLLNGNEVGSILLYYILLRRTESGNLAASGTVIKTVVTTDIAFDMASEFGVEVREVLTGFKYIGELLDKVENYILGFEESCGYLIGTHARDKDGISAAMYIAEACAYFKEKGKSIYQILREISDRYGYYKTTLKTVSMPGRDGMERMKALLEHIRRDPPTEIDGTALELDDFGKGLFGLPPSDVLRFKGNDCRVVIRPSGTEPKMKIYTQVKGKTDSEAEMKNKKIDRFLEKILLLD